MNKRRSAKEIVMVKPSELPKDKNVTLRINGFVKDRLKAEGHSIQKLLDEAVDKKLHKVEFEKKMTIETKK